MNNPQTAEALYEAFISYPRRTTLAANCNCCAPMVLPATLATVPLKEMSSSDFVDVFHLCPEHSGDISDFKHFLPRWLELAAGGDDMINAGGLLAAKLQQNGFDAWPVSEREAVARFVMSAPSTKAIRDIRRILGKQNELVD